MSCLRYVYILFILHSIVWVSQVAYANAHYVKVNAGSDAKKLQLDIAAEDVEVIDVASYFGMYPYGDTLKMYVLNEAKAVIKIVMSNMSLALPPIVKIYLFDEDLSTEDIGKWVNNQMSDALFADAPPPIAVYSILDKNIAVQSRDFTHHTREDGGFEYDHYDVIVSVEALSKPEFDLVSFVTQLEVHILTGHKKNKKR